MKDESKIVLTTSEQIMNLYIKLDMLLDVYKDLLNNFQPKEPEEYLTRHEVAEMFKIDISSVHNWVKRGKLKSYGVPGSGRVYFKRTELEKVLIQINEM